MLTGPKLKLKPKYHSLHLFCGPFIFHQGGGGGQKILGVKGDHHRILSFDNREEKASKTSPKKWIRFDCR